MSSKFLYSAPVSDLTTLSDGTFALDIASAKISELTPNLPIKTDVNGKLVSSLIQPSDINGGILSNPLGGDLNLGNFDVLGQMGLSLKNINSTQILQSQTISDTANKVLNISNAVQDETTMTGKLKIPQIACDSITNTIDLDSSINMFGGNIDLHGLGDLTFNNKSVITTPYSGQIEASSFKKTGGTNLQYLMGDGSTSESNGVGSLETKTQNISLQTALNNTSIVGSVSISQSPEILNLPLFDGVQTQLVSASNYSYGMRFTITQPISIIRLGVLLNHWKVSVGNLTIKFWNEGNSITPIGTYAISQAATYAPTSYFYVPITPLLLPIGTYRMSTGYKAGMFYNGALTPPFTFPSQITNIQSASITSPDGAYPSTLTTLANITAGGYFWFDLPPYGSNINLNTLNGNTILTPSSLDTLNVKTQYQSIVASDTSFSTGLRLNGPITTNGASNIDIMSMDSPYIGVQYVHNSGSLSTQSNSSWTYSGSTSAVSATYALTNNVSRQLCSALWTTTALADGAVCGCGASAGTGAQVSTGFPFGLLFVGNIADSAYNSNNCQNFFGLWNGAPTPTLNQASQISTRLNYIGFASNTTDANICIYSASATSGSTIKHVDLGGYFPANRPAGSVSTDWLKLCLYWDGTTMYYKAVNTSLPTTTAQATVSGSFTPLSTQIPATTLSLFPQCVRIMGTPRSDGQARLIVKRFGVF